MKILRFLALSAVTVSFSSFCTVIYAHDSSSHSHNSAAKIKASTCKQLADPDRYTADANDPDIRALKARCETTRRPAESTVDQKVDGAIKK
jgi:hypothetical protein